VETIEAASGTITEATEPTVETWPSKFKPGDDFAAGGVIGGAGPGASDGPWASFEADAPG